MEKPHNALVRVVTAFFAALIGFGLKHLLDLETDHPLFEYRLVCFIIAVLLFLRFLSGSASHLWLEHIHTDGRSVNLFLADIAFLVIFGILASQISYAQDVRWILEFSIILVGTAIVWAIVVSILHKLANTISVAPWGYLWVPLNIVHCLVFAAALWYVSTEPSASGIQNMLWGVAAFGLIAVGIDLYWQIRFLAHYGK